METVAVTDERLLAAIQGGSSSSDSFWKEALKYLEEIAASVANVADVSSPPKHMRVYVVNDSIKTVPDSSVPMPVSLQSFSGDAAKLCSNYGNDAMSVKTQITEVKYWKSVYGIGGGDLRQALPVVVVDSTRPSKSYANSIAVRNYTTGVEGDIQASAPVSGEGSETPKSEIQ